MYTNDAHASNGSGTTGVRTLIYRRYYGTAFSGNVTITTGTAVNMAATFFSFNGLMSPSIDQTSKSTGNSTAPTSNATFTTAKPDELLIGAMGIDAKSGGPGFGTFTAGAGFITMARGGPGGNPRIFPRSSRSIGTWPP